MITTWCLAPRISARRVEGRGEGDDVERGALLLLSHPHPIAASRPPRPSTFNPLALALPYLSLPGLRTAVRIVEKWSQGQGLGGRRRGVCSPSPVGRAHSSVEAFPRYQREPWPDFLLLKRSPGCRSGAALTLKPTDANGDQQNP